MMVPRGGLEVREYDMLSWLTEGVGDAGGSTDADPTTPGSVGDEVPGPEVPEEGSLADVDAKTWKASMVRASPFKPVFVNLTRCWPGLRSLANHYTGWSVPGGQLKFLANSRGESRYEGRTPSH